MRACVVEHAALTSGDSVTNHEAGLTEIQVRGFKPGRSRRIFQGEKKNPQHAFLRKGSKAVCRMSHICGM